MTTAELHHIFLKHPIVCTDTRKITADCIFFALKGDNFNGNTYANEAIKKGATLAIIDESDYELNDKTILVHDVLKALQNLANYHRKYSQAKIIGLTGSNGKTTTKELIHSVLEKKYKTIATIGNLNNHIGVPLTLLRIKPETEIAIVEMGANHQKEIEFLCTLAEPDFGYITNFGKAHLEGFGGEEGVIKGKSELYTYLIENIKAIFMNADDSIQFQKLSTYVKKYGFSQDQHEYYTIKFLGADPYVKLSFENEIITSQLVGSYNFTNCCAAILMGKFFNVTPKDISAAIHSYIPENNRSQLINKNGHQIILDAYNANPTSMIAALHNFKAMKAAHKIAILGDMFELGNSAKKEHQNIAEVATSMSFDMVLLVGENFYNTDTKTQKLENFEALKVYLTKTKLPSSSILIKGSRGMALERVLDFI
ncbi:UDP-N-acetylmuramoyl-tripeptide--D-alanyl-D-alanine ligase [Aurantibacter crassamenti]|uniref:UDP-N-acetylmuramoyl-tripeptide--D-alanyl-D- alanine ligase n=1 Tax=Aurantibacter crassamenti TaxID=1837375 RepID=UPI00193A119F|nr:UDP-N-acetylmuramoyl-tripeptide--D-alanyl-D-alanine ligase [Aurantibacter crassamenti]MBM1104613.1 UDP-N-acetylmuramoyl-tripeptide--D-alanyl-D-alanine ligase [Aurantibacter crassamenti]